MIAWIFFLIEITAHVATLFSVCGVALIASLINVFRCR